MSDQTQSEKGDDRSAPELTRLIETACQRFEAAWQTGKVPRIEDYLDTFPESLRAELARSLQALDQAHRDWSGEQTTGECSWDQTTEAVSFNGAEQSDLVSTNEADVPDTVHGADETTIPYDPAQARSPKSTSPSSIDPDAPLMEDDFQLLSQLGAGGMGEVFEGVQKSLRKRVALKMIKREALDSPNRVRRFVAEARTLARAQVLVGGRVADVQDRCSRLPRKKLGQGSPGLQSCSDDHIFLTWGLCYHATMCCASGNMVAKTWTESSKGPWRSGRGRQWRPTIR